MPSNASAITPAFNLYNPFLQLLQPWHQTPCWSHAAEIHMNSKQESEALQPSKSSTLLMPTQRLPVAC